MKNIAINNNVHSMIQLNTGILTNPNPKYKCGYNLSTLVQDMCILIGRSLFPVYSNEYEIEQKEAPITEWRTIPMA